MKYAEKLRDPRWQKKRLEIMERDGFMCQSCGSKHRTLNVHHTFYEKGKDPWDFDAKSLVTLCEECHEAEPAAFDEVIHDLNLMFRQYGWLSDDVGRLCRFVMTNHAIHPRFPAWVDSDLLAQVRGQL